jgi:tetratricopeptide (TPR) repeat protein
LWPLHEQGKHSDDMVAVNETGVAEANRVGDDLAAAVLGFQLGFAHRQRGELERAVEVLTAARQAAARTGSPTVEATAVESLALVLLDLGERTEAAGLLRQNLALAERIGEPRRLALARFHCAKVEPPELALRLLDQARLAFDGLPSEQYNLVKTSLWRGKKLIEQGTRLAEASAVLTAAAAAASEGSEDRWHFERAQVSAALADLALAHGDRDVAASHLRDALDICRLRGFTPQAIALEQRLAEFG